MQNSINFKDKVRLYLNKDLDFKEVLKQGGISFLLKLAGLLLGYIFTLMVTRKLGAEALGIYSLSSTLMILATIFASIGVDAFLVRIIAKYSSKSRRDAVWTIYVIAMRIVIFCSVIISAFIYLGSDFLASAVFQKTYLASYFQIASLGILPLAVIYVLISSFKGIKEISISSFLQDVGKFLIGIFLLALLLKFSSYNFLSPLIAMVISLWFLAILGTILWIRKQRSIFSSSIFKILNYGRLAKISFPLLLTSSMFFLISWVDTIMLGILATDGEVGIYNVALKLGFIPGFILVAANNILAPKFAELYAKKNMEGLRIIAQRSTKVILFFSIPILLVLLLFSSFFLGLFGEDFIVGRTVLGLICAGQFINAAVGSVGYLLQMSGKQKVFSFIILTATIINILLNYLLIPLYGINGAGIASMVSLIFMNVVPFILVKKYFGFYTLKLF